MNPINRNNIIRHELIGLNVNVYSSQSGHSKILYKGKVVDETKNTLLISNDTEKKRFPKNIAEFYFTLQDDLIKIDGREIVGRPVERIKMVRKK